MDKGLSGNLSKINESGCFMQMQTLSDLYSEIADHSCIKRWFYYYNSVRSEYDIPHIQDCWENDESAYRFIEQYLRASGKAWDIIYGNNEYVRRAMRWRPRHIVSVFLLGIKVAESFGFFNASMNEGGFNFLYYWFLACLHHDIGYMHEKLGEENFNTIEREIRDDIIQSVGDGGLRALSGICEIKIKPLNSDDNRAIFKIYNKKIVELYLKNRARGKGEHENKIDHGIAGGILLYDMLKKIRDMRLENGEEESTFDTDTSIGLNVNKFDYREYGKVAEAIIVHNIRPYELEKYLEKEWYDKEIVTKNAGPHITCNHQLAFTLAIADTIEPLKNEISLDSVMIGEFNEGGNRGIHVQMDDFCGKIDEGIANLKDWVNVVVD